MERGVLYWKTLALGAIADLSPDWPWVWADFDPFPEAESLRGFFAFMVDEEKSGDPGDEYDEELLDECNWTIVDESGQERGVCVPAVHWDDRTIAWRWR